MFVPQVGRDVLLPIRWMSPESIMYRKYTTESDCWSFGILLWEILTYGKQPWFEYTNTEVIKYVTRGQHLVPPDDCPEEIVELMKSCWQFNPSERETMFEIHEKFVELERRIEDGTLKLPEPAPIIPQTQTSLPPPVSRTKSSTDEISNCFPITDSYSGDVCRSKCSQNNDNDNSTNNDSPAVYLELSHA